MKVKYTKILQTHGEYRASRIIWITTLKKEELIKFDVVDSKGNLLYQITEPPEYDRFTISKYGDLTEERLQEIKELMVANDPDYEWAVDTEEEATFLLANFGRDLVCCQFLARESRGCEDAIVYYSFDSSEEKLEKLFLETLFFKLNESDEKIIKRSLLPKLLKCKNMDRIDVVIARNGMSHKYLVMLQ